MTDRLHDIKISGVVYNEYLDPVLGTEMALVMEPYYAWREPHGKGWSYLYKQVPHETVLDLLEDMGNVAYICSASGDSNTGAAMRKVIRRIEKVIGEPTL